MKQLADGHWVLAFGDADRAANAKLLVYQHTVALRSAYSRHLAPLTGDAQQGSMSSGGGGGGAVAGAAAGGETAGSGPRAVN
jgi:hypothetical protein